MSNTSLNKNPHPLQLSAAVWLCALALLSSCEDSSEAGEALNAGTQGPAYLAATRIWDDSSTTSYFHVLPSIAEGTTVATDRALEVSGAAKLYAVQDIGWFAIGGGDAPTITRYKLAQEGGLEKDVSISLQSYGVTSLWDSLYVVSKTKAYYPDTTQSQLIVFNPSAMTVDGVIPLPQTVREGYLSYYSLTPVLRGKELVFSVGWFDWSDTDSVIGETGLVVLDTERDAVTRYDVNERCGGITQTIELASGDAYFVSSALAASAYRLDRLSTEPCALRMRAGETAFDADYLLALKSLTGGKLAGEPVPGTGNTLFLRVFDEDAAEIEPGAMTWALTGQTVWQWWKLDTETQRASYVDKLEAVDGRRVLVPARRQGLRQRDHRRLLRDYTGGAQRRRRPQNCDHRAGIPARHRADPLTHAGLQSDSGEPAK